MTETSCENLVLKWGRYWKGISNTSSYFRWRSLADGVDFFMLRELCVDTWNSNAALCCKNGITVVIYTHCTPHNQQVHCTFAKIQSVFVGIQLSVDGSSLELDLCDQSKMNVEYTKQKTTPHFQNYIHKNLWNVSRMWI